MADSISIGGHRVSTNTLVLAGATVAGSLFLLFRGKGASVAVGAPQPAAAVDPSSYGVGGFGYALQAAPAPAAAASCMPPLAGCPAGTYWDPVSCACLPNPQVPGPCQPPPAGCPQGTSWNPATCSCVQVAAAPPPVQYPYPAGVMIHLAGDPTQWMISSDMKRWGITSLSAFSKCGYNWNHDFTVTSDQMAMYPIGGYIGDNGPCPPEM